MSMLHKTTAVLVVYSLLLEPAYAQRRVFGRFTRTPQQTQQLSAPTKVSKPTAKPAVTKPVLEASALVASSDIAPPKLPPEPVVVAKPIVIEQSVTPPTPPEAFTASGPTSTPDWWSKIIPSIKQTAPTIFVQPERQQPTVFVTPDRPFSLVPSSVEAVKSDSGNTQEAAPPPPPAPELASADPYPVPAIELGGIDKALPLGELVQIWIKPMAAKPDRLRSTSYTWTVLPPRNVVVWPDASKIIFGSGTKPQAYTIIVTGSYVYAPDATADPKAEVVQRLITKIQTIQVGDPTAIPNPSDPLPPESPMSPVAKKIFEFTQLVTTDNNYPILSFKRDAAQLAKNFNAIVAALEDPDPAARAKLATIGDIMKATKTINDSNKVSNRTAWQPWFEQTEELLRQAYSNATIKTPQDAVAWWRDIAAGLTAAVR